MKIEVGDRVRIHAPEATEWWNPFTNLHGKIGTVTVPISGYYSCLRTKGERVPLAHILVDRDKRETVLGHDHLVVI